VSLRVDHTVTELGDEVHIRIGGELDLATHGDLKAGLSDIDLDGAAVVRLHLAGLTFCDSRGGRLLVLFLRQATHRGLLVSVEDPTPAVRRVLLLVVPDPMLLIRPRALPASSVAAGRGDRLGKLRLFKCEG
jgi:anti-anti-sigma factor